MEKEILYKHLKEYFPNNLDLMRHLDTNACWEYIITEKTTKDEFSILHYFLFKKYNGNLEMTEKKPDIKPDLILYFTEKAILELIEGNPSADEYYKRYRKIMNNIQKNEYTLNFLIGKPFPFFE